MTARPLVKRAGAVFAIARISNGTKSIDGQFKANWTGLKQVGILRGAYQLSTNLV